MPAHETVHILHVDDNDDNRLSTKLMLDRPGVEVVSAASARVAREVLHRHDFALAWWT